MEHILQSHTQGVKYCALLNSRSHSYTPPLLLKISPEPIRLVWGWMIWSEAYFWDWTVFSSMVPIPHPAPCVCVRLYLPPPGKHKGCTIWEIPHSGQCLLSTFFGCFIAASGARKGPVTFSFGAADAHFQPRDIIFSARAHTPVTQCCRGIKDTHTHVLNTFCFGLWRPTMPVSIRFYSKDGASSDMPPQLWISIKFLFNKNQEQQIWLISSAGGYDEIS